MPSQPQDFQKKSKKNLKTTSAAQWKKKSGAKPVDVELPSGNVAKVRQIPMTTLLSDGLFPDSMANIVRSSIDGKQSKAELEAQTNAQMAEMAEDPKKMLEMFSVIDKIMVQAVVEPAVQLPPEDDEDRDDEVLYADEVDIEDKMFIFNFCVGGSKDIERFREESKAALGSMADLEGVRDSSE